LCALALALYGISAASWAQTSPDAGQLLRDVQQTPLAPMVQPAALPTADAPADAHPSVERAFRVNALVFSGNQEVPTTDLQTLVGAVVNTEQTLGQLNALARRITTYYREKGFAVARAYLPAQDITDGQVTVSIIEGRMARSTLTNQSRLSDARASAYLGDAKDGDVIRTAQIERGLLLLQDTPGVGASRATLQPGASPGTSELLIDLQPAAALSGNATLDNYGSRSTNEYRLGANLNLASPLQIGDQLAMSGLTSGDNLQYGRLAYQLPIGADGLRVGVAVFGIRYKLGKEFEALEAHGTAHSGTVYASYPFIRSAARNLSGTASFEDKHLNDVVDSTSTTTGKSVHIGSLGLSGSQQDGLGGGGVTSLDLSLVLGQLGIQSASALALDTASAQTNGSYRKLTYAASRKQRLTNSTLVLATLAGQQASKNLDSSEKFNLGGPTGVRAYPTSEATGDNGYRATLELQQNLLPGLQGTLFYDAGTIRINKTVFDATAANHRTLSGAGFGLNAHWGRFDLRTSLAWRISGGMPTSIPESAAKSPTLGLQATLAL
jgi:hemolysin activation/secretion protein